MTAQETKVVDASEIIRRANEDRAAWEAVTVGAKVTEWNGDYLTPAVVTRDVTVAELREVFDAYRGAALSWKDPVAVYVPARKVMVFVEAVKFFQGCQPEVSQGQRADEVKVTSDGYCC